MADQQNKGTLYVVLEKATADTTAINGGPDPEGPDDASDIAVFVPAGEATARTDTGAIALVEKKLGRNFDRGAVAVPARSWRIRTGEDEQREPRRVWK